MPLVTSCCCPSLLVNDAVKLLTKHLSLQALLFCWSIQVQFQVWAKKLICLWKDTWLGFLADFADTREGKRHFCHLVHCKLRQRVGTCNFHSGKGSVSSEHYDWQTEWITLVILSERSNKGEKKVDCFTITSYVPLYPWHWPLTLTSDIDLWWWDYLENCLISNKTPGSSI